MTAAAGGQLIECLLYLDGYGRRRGQMIALRLETVLIRNVGQRDALTLRAAVGEGALGHLSLGALNAGIFQVAHLLGLNAIARFIFILARIE